MAFSVKGYSQDRGVFPLSELLNRTCEEFGDRPVMRTWAGRDTYTEITYNELRDRVNALASWLIESGIRKGDRVGVLGENGPDWSTVYLAVHVAGAVVVPVDRLMPSSGIRHIVSDSGARLLFVSPTYRDVLE
ncbi:AMP-binding protein, partial [bacterium]|nr:AMP-binding protein [bacterium]